MFSPRANVKRVFLNNDLGDEETILKTKQNPTDRNGKPLMRFKLSQVSTAIEYKTIKNKFQSNLIEKERKKLENKNQPILKE